MFGVAAGWWRGGCDGGVGVVARGHGGGVGCSVARGGGVVGAWWYGAKGKNRERKRSALKAVKGASLTARLTF